MMIVLLISAYLLGSIPFGLIVTRLAGLGDVRHIGSGNIGATNVLRTGHKGLAALTLLLDAAKGFAAVMLEKHYFFLEMSAVKMPPGAVESAYLHSIEMIGLMAVLGHIFPVWLKFKGGKGVATAIGVMLGISPMIGLSIMAVWLIVFFASRISSLAALLSFALNCITAAVLNGEGDFKLMVLLTYMLCITHRENIKRLFNGTEPSFRKDNP